MHVIPGRGCVCGVVGRVCYRAAGRLRSDQGVVKLKSIGKWHRRG